MLNRTRWLWTRFCLPALAIALWGATAGAETVSFRHSSKPFNYSGASGSVSYSVRGDGPGEVTIPAQVEGDSGSWLHVKPGWESRNVQLNAKGSGKGSVKYTVDRNPSSRPRTGTLSIGGAVFTVTQGGAPCTVAVSPPESLFPWGDADGVVGVTAPDGCGWQASVESRAPWITISGSSVGEGSGSVVFSVSSNPDAKDREGKLYVTPVRPKPQKKAHRVRQEKLSDEPGQDYASNFVGLWTGTLTGTLGGEPLPPEENFVEITRKAINRLSLANVCPDGSAVPAVVTGPTTFDVSAFACPAVRADCGEIVFRFTSGSGTVSETELSLTGSGTVRGCGVSLPLEWQFTGTLPNPAPTLTSLSPEVAEAGASGLTIRLAGSGFVRASRARWNGAERDTTYLSEEALDVTLSAEDLAEAGSGSLTVENPQPGGGVSAALALAIGNPVPVVRAISPSSAAPGGSRFTLTLAGNGFVATTVARWNGDPRPTTVVSREVLHVAIGAEDIALPGSATVSVLTPSPFGGTTDAGTFAIAERPAPAPQAVAYQINPAHSGRVELGVPVAFPQDPAWSVSLPGPLSYPVIAGGKVFVLTGGSGTGEYGTQLHALDLASGAPAWGPIPIQGTYFWSTHAYEAGSLFVLNFDGRLRAFDAATGASRWSVDLPEQWSFTAAPTASGGLVYVGGAGSGGTLYAVNQSDGSLVWSKPVENGDQSSPAVGPDGLFVSYSCQVYKLDLITGEEIWRFNGPCSGGGGKTSVYARDRVYVRDPFQTNPAGKIFDAFDGSALGTFGPEWSYLPVPACGTSSDFFLWDGVLRSRDAATGNTLWTFTGDGGLSSAPIVVNDVAVVGSASGKVYALDGATGTLVWTGTAPSEILPPDEQNVSQPLTGLAAGEGYLLVPAGNTLTAWRIVAP